ncbi:hypothetical protein BGX38DRAFT_1214378, partial [Terfezia claveryi]
MRSSSSCSSLALNTSPLAHPLLTVPTVNQKDEDPGMQEMCCLSYCLGMQLENCGLLL